MAIELTKGQRLYWERRVSKQALQIKELKSALAEARRALEVGHLLATTNEMIPNDRHREYREQLDIALARQSEASAPVEGAIDG